jgi:DNA-binding response OmpR family regulator
MRLLVIEDDAQLSKLMRLVLAEDGYAVDVAHAAADGAMLAMVNPYDAVVLDLGLPDRNGLNVLRELRRAGRTTPVLVLTGAGESESVVRALDAGADDYVVKPVPGAVLKARVRALLRRGGATRTEALVAGNVTLDRIAREVRVGGIELALTAKPLAVLECLLLRAGQVVTRSQLLEQVWDMHFDPDSNVVEVNVTRLRKALADAGATVLLETRRGAGYRLVPAQSPAAAGAADGADPVG